MPVGIVDNTFYFESQRYLAEGDWLLLYTDGVTDIRCPSGRRLGMEGLLNLSRQAKGANTREVFNQFVERLVELNSGYGFEDDLTLVLLRRNAAHGSREPI